MLDLDIDLTRSQIGDSKIGDIEDSIRNSLIESNNHRNYTGLCKFILIGIFSVFVCILSICLLLKYNKIQ
jgi:hypothetical protein